MPLLPISKAHVSGLNIGVSIFQPSQKDSWKTRLTCQSIVKIVPFLP